MAISVEMLLVLTLVSVFGLTSASHEWECLANPFPFSSDYVLSDDGQHTEYGCTTEACSMQTFADWAYCYYGDSSGVTPRTPEDCSYTAGCTLLDTGSTPFYLNMGEPACVPERLANDVCQTVNCLVAYVCWGVAQNSSDPLAYESCPNHAVPTTDDWYAYEFLPLLEELYNDFNCFDSQDDGSDELCTYYQSHQNPLTGEDGFQLCLNEGCELPDWQKAMYCMYEDNQYNVVDYDCVDKPGCYLNYDLNVCMPYDMDTCDVTTCLTSMTCAAESAVYEGIWNVSTSHESCSFANAQAYGFGADLWGEGYCDDGDDDDGDDVLPLCEETDYQVPRIKASVLAAARQYSGMEKACFDLQAVYDSEEDSNAL